MLLKIRDYYSDNVLLFGELASFENELKTIQKNNKNISLEKLIAFVSNTRSASKSIFVLAD